MLDRTAITFSPLRMICAVLCVAVLFLLVGARTALFAPPLGAPSTTAERAPSVLRCTHHAVPTPHHAVPTRAPGLTPRYLVRELGR